MKLRNLHQHCKGITLMEVLVIIVILVILIGLTMPGSISTSRPKARRIQCINNLKQCSLALLVWAGDHGDKLPFQVSTNEGGSLEYISSKEIFRHFLTVSNELGSSIVFFCPADTERLRAVTFSSFNNQNLSYFLALNALRTNGSSVLAGDRNVAVNGQDYANGNYLIPTNQSLSWGKGIHYPGGNLVFCRWTR